MVMVEMHFRQALIMQEMVPRFQVAIQIIKQGLD